MKKNYLLKITLMISMVFAAFFAQAQTGSISGTVYDEAKLPLAGASVTINNTSRAVVTGSDGKYTIANVAAGTYTVTVKFIGLETKSSPVTVGTGAANLDFNMVTDAANIEETVVIGYGTQKKSVVTGAISKITASDLENKPVMRIEQSLQGRTSGLTITTNSGQPGEGAALRVRGTTSINNSEPLYIVDGVQVGGGIDYLAQSDIESAEVLKDAASAAIYGARSASGVIIITTKKGSNTGGIKVNYNGYVGTQAPARKLDLLNGVEYATLYNEAQLASYPNAAIKFPNPAQFGEGTDWQSAVFNNNAMLQNHELSIAGGNEKSKYYSSFGYWDQEGIVASNNSKYNRFTARFNSEHIITKSIKFGQTLGYTRTNSMGVSTNSEYGSPLSRAINMDPITPVIETNPAKYGAAPYTTKPVVRTADGFPYGISEYAESEVLNPIAALAVAQGDGWSDKIVGNAFVEAEFIKGLKLRSSAGVDLAFWGGEGFTPVYYLNNINQVDLNSYSRNDNRGLFWQLENTLTYSRQINKHNFSILGGYSAQRYRGESQNGYKQGIPVTNIKDASLRFPVDIKYTNFGGGEDQNTLNSVFGRLTYDYNEKYLFTGIIRRDGSSRFGPENKYGVFPSASVGWVISKEGFFPQNRYVNFLKLRGSYGVTGNDNIGDFRYLSTVSGGRNYTLGTSAGLSNGVSPDALSNPELRWEQTSQLNFGLDAALLGNKLTFSAEWYDKKTTDMLLGIAVPGYVGNNGPIGNIADMSNKGIEFELGYNTNFGDVDFKISGNASFLKNRVTFLGEDKTFLGGQTITPQGLQVTRTEIGYAIGSFYGFRSDGLFQNAADVANYKNAGGTPIQPNAKPGDIRFRDLNGDGLISNDDREIIGDPTPDFTYGLTVSAGYKGFDIYVLGQGVSGNQIFNGLRRFDLVSANYTTDILSRWTGDGTSNSMPRLAAEDTNGNYSKLSSLFLESGAYFRIKTMQIGYTLPQALTKKAGVNKLRFYVMAQNLVTFTKYKGYDPEIGGGSYGVDRGFYPQARSFFAGINVGF